MINLEKSLNELEGHINSSDPNDALVKKVEEIRKKRLKDLTVEDLALLLRQKISLEFVVPLCLNKLDKDILIEMERSGLRLLPTLLKIEKDFWSVNQDLYNQTADLMNGKMDEIMNPEMDNPVELDSYISDQLPEILKSYQNFRDLE
ncbi:MAG: contact-dependent growth inhibition system immunity protein [Patescibacteria group bacterium]